MSNLRTGVSACRRCRFYQVEGRRGGHCRQLNVPVQASWVACPLAAPLFVAEWEICQTVVAVGQHLLEPAYEVTSTATFTDLPLPEIPIHEAIAVPVTADR